MLKTVKGIVIGGYLVSYLVITTTMIVCWYKMLTNEKWVDRNKNEDVIDITYTELSSKKGCGNIPFRF